MVYGVNGPRAATPAAATSVTVVPPKVGVQAQYLADAQVLLAKEAAAQRAMKADATAAAEAMKAAAGLPVPKSFSIGALHLLADQGHLVLLPRTHGGGDDAPTAPALPSPTPAPPTPSPTLPPTDAVPTAIPDTDADDDPANPDLAPPPVNNNRLNHGLY